MALNYGASNLFANPFPQRRRGLLWQRNTTPYLSPLYNQYAGMSPYGYGSPQTSAWPGGFRDRIFNADDAKQWAGSGASNLFANPFSRSQQGLLGQMSAIAGQDVTSPFLNNLSFLYNQYGGMTPYGGTTPYSGYGSPQTSAWPGGYKDQVFNANDAKQWAGFGASNLFANPFSRSQRSLLRRMSATAGQDVTSPYLNNLSSLYNQYGSMTPYGGTNGSQGYDYMSQMGDIGNQLGSLGAWRDKWDSGVRLPESTRESRPGRPDSDQSA